MDQDSWRALLRARDLPLLVALAFGLYALGIWLAVVQVEWMPLGLRRILEVQRHLASGDGPEGGVALLGSSVVLEGASCVPLVLELPTATRCENLAWTGGNVRQWLLIAPALRASPPRLVILGLDLFTLLHPDPVPSERLAIAGFWRFLPEADLLELHGAFDADELGVLGAPRAAQLLRFRSFPLNALNERVREAARSDLRYDGYTTNFTDPWVRRQAASGTALAVHLEQVRTMIREGGTDRLPETVRSLELLLARVRVGAPETRFLLVLTPAHPALVATLPEGALAGVHSAVAALAVRVDAELRDDTRLLGASGFSDAVHPFAEGRSAWSQALGRAAALQLAD